MQAGRIFQCFTMKMDYLGGSGSLVEVIPVLSDDRYIKVFLKSGGYMVCLIRTQRKNLSSYWVDEVQHCLSFLLAVWTASTVPGLVVCYLFWVD